MINHIFWSIYQLTRAADCPERKYSPDSFDYKNSVTVNMSRKLVNIRMVINR